MTDTLIIQFAKWPQLGKVKTRLAKKIGDKAAYDTHIELVQTVLDNLTRSSLGDVELWFDQLSSETPESHPITKLCSERSVSIAYQHGEDLGERMHHGLALGLKAYKKVIIVGSDCPTVDKPYLAKAINELDRNDLVFGPAEDGGYVLIGARIIKPTFLDEIKWGESTVLQATVKCADKLGLTYELLDTTWDVDEYEDYLRWKGRLL